MFTIREASKITGLPYGRLWYGGMTGRYSRPGLKVGNRSYYTKEQLHQLAEQVKHEQAVEYKHDGKESK